MGELIPKVSGMSFYIQTGMAQELEQQLNFLTL